MKPYRSFSAPICFHTKRLNGESQNRTRHKSKNSYRFTDKDFIIETEIAFQDLLHYLQTDVVRSNFDQRHQIESSDAERDERDFNVASRRSREVFQIPTVSNQN